MKIDEVKIGDKVNYGFYTNITFEGMKNEDTVILKDVEGEVDYVSKYLFEKYSSKMKQ